MEHLGIYLIAVMRVRQAQWRAAAAGHEADAGVSTLEMVIIALGLMAVAGLLVAAVTAAVTSRTNQLR